MKSIILFVFVFSINSVVLASAPSQSCENKKVVGKITKNQLFNLKDKIGQFNAAYVSLNVKEIAKFVDPSDSASTSAYITSRLNEPTRHSYLTGIRHICVTNIDRIESGYFALVRGRVIYREKSKEEEEFYYYVLQRQNKFFFTEFMFRRIDFFETGLVKPRIE